MLITQQYIKINTLNCLIVKKYYNRWIKKTVFICERKCLMIVFLSWYNQENDSEGMLIMGAG